MRTSSRLRRRGRATTRLQGGALASGLAAAGWLAALVLAGLLWFGDRAPPAPGDDVRDSGAREPALPPEPPRAAGDVAPRMRDLLAKTSEVTKRFYPDAERSGRAVTVRYRGLHFDPPQVLPMVERPEAGRQTPVDALAGWFSAFRTRDREWIIETFSPSERSGIAERTQDAEEFRKNTDFFQLVESVAVKEVLLYGTYAVVVFEHRLQNGTPLERPATLVEVDGEWFVTNQAAKNPFFSDIIPVLMKTGDEVEVVR